MSFEKLKAELPKENSPVDCTEDKQIIEYCQDDMEETVWQEAQDVFVGASAELLEAMAGITKETLKSGYADGWATKFSRLALLVRNAYLWGYANGYAGVDPETNLDPRKAFAETMEQDDTTECQFDGEVSPGKETRRFIENLSKLDDFQED